MKIEDFERLVEIGSDWQLRCPIYQRAVYEMWAGRPASRRSQRDAICDFYRDHASTLFWQPVAEIDHVLKDDDATALGRLADGATIRNVGLIRLIDGVVRVQNPALLSFGRMHARAHEVIH